MSVEELIAELQKIEDKTLICKVYDADMDAYYPVNFVYDVDDYVSIG